MTKRKLVSTRVVEGVEDIPGADRIELARFGLWRAVVGKGDFKPGDVAVYFEIDAFVKSGDPRFAVLARTEKDTALGRGSRIRTMELMGVLSQGLALPVGMFPELSGVGLGEDVADRLGVVKWEDEIPDELAGKARGYLPALIPRTSQERIQNDPGMLDRPGLWEGTVKVDGVSMTVYRMEGVTGVCSHEVDLLETPDCPYWKAARDSGLIGAMESQAGDFAVQGELAGPGIRGNPDGLEEKEFFSFHVWDIERQRSLSPEERRDFERGLGRNGWSGRPVPLVATVDFKGAGMGAEDVLAMSDGTNPMTGRPREGIVWTSQDGQFSFKAISNSYLLGLEGSGRKREKKRAPGV